jgi:4-amino-4-deoxy-L-arabinose transferase-like glycosyltransferase
MKQFVKNYWILIMIVMLAFTLRVYKLDQYPVGLTWDEPALAYNAYSILKTGKDEYGATLPMTFKSFGDYKPGFYIYTAVPSIALFGLNLFGIRFPSALAGVGSVIAIFFLTRMIFSQRKNFTAVPYLTSLLFAISPWSLNFSRGAWELNLALFCIIMAVIFLLKALENNFLKWSILAFVFFTFAFDTYHGAKVFLVPFLAGLIVILWSKISILPRKNKIISLLLVIFLLFPLFLSFQGSANRAKTTGIFSYTRQDSVIEGIKEQEVSNPEFNFAVFHSEILNTTRGLLERYFNHFSGKFLFFEGDWGSPRHSTPYMGVLYLIEIPFLIIGIGYLLAAKKDKKESLILWWLLTAPIPSAVTRDIVQAGRSSWMEVPLMIIIACGIWVTISFVKDKLPKLTKLFSLLIITGYLYCFSSYLDLYYVHFPILNSQGWNYGIEEVVNYIKDNKDKYQKIIFTQERGQPYIFYLFFTKYPPEIYQTKAKLTENPNGDVGTVDFLDNIEFRSSFWPADRDCHNCLIIDDEIGLPENFIKETPWAKIIKDVKFLDGKIAFRMVETK